MRTKDFLRNASFVALLCVAGGSCTIKSNDSSGGGGGGGGGPDASMNNCPTPTPPDPPAAGATKGPCDIYAADGGPCVAAHSTIRALYASYNGPLYQVKKPDGTTMDIGVSAPGGLAKSEDQDTFCGTDACTISIVYDQSGWKNHLTHAPAGMNKKTPGNEANAKSAPLMIGTHKVYGIHVVPGIGYRNNEACGTAMGDNAETEYMVVAGAAYNGACCFDYGNMERNSSDNGEGTMEAVYFGNCTVWNRGYMAPGSTTVGPWVMGDLENGLWAGDASPYDGNKPISDWPYITAMVKGDAAGKNHWAIKEADATKAGPLTVAFDGKRPSARYNPMRKEGAIGLGTGGDNTNSDKGDWFEGVMTATFSSDSADEAVQANIFSVYGQQ